MQRQRAGSAPRQPCGSGRRYKHNSRVLGPSSGTARSPSLPAEARAPGEEAGSRERHTRCSVPGHHCRAGAEHSGASTGSGALLLPQGPAAPPAGPHLQHQHWVPCLPQRTLRTARGGLAWLPAPQWAATLQLTPHSLPADSGQPGRVASLTRREPCPLDPAGSCQPRLAPPLCAPAACRSWGSGHPSADPLSVWLRRLVSPSASPHDGSRLAAPGAPRARSPTELLGVPRTAASSPMASPGRASHRLSHLSWSPGTLRGAARTANTALLTHVPSWSAWITSKQLVALPLGWQRASRA